MIKPTRTGACYKLQLHHVLQVLVFPRILHEGKMFPYTLLILTGGYGYF